MHKHPVRKLLGLTLLYAALIVGIFVIQFKSESVFTESAGPLRLTLAQTEGATGESSLKNSLSLSYGGLTFSANDDVPAYLVLPDGTQRPLVLDAWQRTGDSAMQLAFADGTLLEFAAADGASGEQLTVAAHPSDPDGSVSLAYKVSGSYATEELTDSRLVLSSKGKRTALTAPSVTADRIAFSGADSVALLSPYDPEQRFDFAQLVGRANTERSAYDSFVKQLRAAVVNSFTQILGTAQADSLTEAEVTAYVAEQSANGRYNAALDAVPDSFKRATNRRTYVSSPYFDSLVAMNRSLTVQTEIYTSQVDQAIATRNLGIFGVDRITDFILREKKTARIENLLLMPSTIEDFAPTVAQAASLVNVWCQLLDDGEERLAALLEDAANASLAALEDAASFDDDTGRLSLLQDGEPPDRATLLAAAHALVSAGSVTGRAELVAAGSLVAWQEQQELSSYPLSLLAELYPLLVDNSFYPHTVVLGYYGDRPVWTWTCARSVTYTKTATGTIDLRIDFPLNDTHYVTVIGVPTFHANIEIQELAFRSDPRFETYNSSGYVYNEELQTLYLKSRHKSQVELIRLFCDQTTAFTYTDGTRP